jgi:hypothetical protein
MVPPLNRVRGQLGLAPVAGADDIFGRVPLLLYLTAEPFEYPRRDWPGNVVLVGPCDWDPPADPPGWLEQLDRPVVLVTTSSEFQDDHRLVKVTLQALAEEPVAVVVTLPAGAAILVRPGPLPEPPHHHDPAAPAQRLGGMLGLVAPHHHGEEARLTIPAAGDGHPKRRPGDAPIGVAQLGVVGEVAGEADLRPACCCPPVAWPGGLPCPGNRGTVDALACHKATRGKPAEPTKSAPAGSGCRAGSAQEPAWLGGGACGWWSGMPAPPGQPLPPWAWREIEAPAAGAGRGPAQATNGFWALA